MPNLKTVGTCAAELLTIKRSFLSVFAECSQRGVKPICTKFGENTDIDRSDAQHVNKIPYLPYYVL